MARRKVLRKSKTVPRQTMTVERIIALIPIGRTTILKMEREGRFPASHQDARGQRVWYEDEIAKWQANLPRYVPPRKRAKRAR